jgi:hypothetical protein
VQSKGLLEYVGGILETGPHCLFTLEFLFRGEEERKVVEGRGVKVVCGRSTISRLGGFVLDFRRLWTFVWVCKVLL